MPEKASCPYICLGFVFFLSIREKSWLKYFDIQELDEMNGNDAPTRKAKEDFVSLKMVFSLFHWFMKTSQQEETLTVVRQWIMAMSSNCVCRWK